jgi:hypothetical protein
MINNDAPARNSLTNHCPEAPGNTLGTTIWNILRTSRSKEIFPPTLPPEPTKGRKLDLWGAAISIHNCVHHPSLPTLSNPLFDCE